MYSQDILNSGNWGSIDQWVLKYCKNEYAVCPGCNKNISKGIGVMQRQRDIEYDHWFCMDCFEQYVKDTRKASR